jgi:hypothetical protein
MDAEKRIAVFLADYDYQVNEIKGIFGILRTKKTLLKRGSVSSEIVESAGYWVHNLYSAFEDLFKIVAGFWENDAGSNGEFHISLLRRMLVSIEGIRPPLLSEESYRLLNELRGFRHVFRYAYSYGLDKDRVSSLLDKTLEREGLLRDDLEIFRSGVAAMTHD